VKAGDVLRTYTFNPTDSEPFSELAVVVPSHANLAGAAKKAVPHRLAVGMI
jgi:hypothetical protein